MSEKYPYKNVPVFPETHRRLSVLKAEEGHGSFDETIKNLLDVETQLKIAMGKIEDIEHENYELREYAFHPEGMAKEDKRELYERHLRELDEEKA